MESEEGLQGASGCDQNLGCCWGLCIFRHVRSNEVGVREHVMLVMVRSTYGVHASFPGYSHRYFWMLQHTIY